MVTQRKPFHAEVTLKNWAWVTATSKQSNLRATPATYNCKKWCFVYKYFEILFIIIFISFFRQRKSLFFLFPKILMYTVIRKPLSLSMAETMTDHCLAWRWAKNSPELTYIGAFLGTFQSGKKILSSVQINEYWILFIALLLLGCYYTVMKKL